MPVQALTQVTLSYQASGVQFVWLDVYDDFFPYYYL